VDALIWGIIGAAIVLVVLVIWLRLDGRKKK
jgi:hypothetical protein